MYYCAFRMDKNQVKVEKNRKLKDYTIDPFNKCVLCVTVSGCPYIYIHHYMYFIPFSLYLICHCVFWWDPEAISASPLYSLLEIEFVLHCIRFRYITILYIIYVCWMSVCCVHVSGYWWQLLRCGASSTKQIYLHVHIIIVMYLCLYCNTNWFDYWMISAYWWKMCMILRWFYITIGWRKTFFVFAKNSTVDMNKW